MLTVALVVLVIFLFLRNLSATVIPSVAVPLSLVGTFGVMYLLGYSLNNLSLMALTISTGFVVDDAIVMIENITRYIEEGEPPLQAALKGSAQIGFTIVSLTISLIAVLIPLLFMGDIVGRLFREFAVTLAVTILVSAVVSLTLTPMMCSKLLKHSPEAEQTRFYRVTEQGWKAIISFYDRTLQVVLRHQTITLLVAAATLVLTILLYIYIPKGFFPIQDTGVIQGVSEASETVSFPEMARLQEQLGKIILKDPAVESLSSFIGIDGTNTTLNSGRILINLKPIDERGIGAIRRYPPPAAGTGSSGRESLCLCSPCRTSRWRTASAARSSNTPSRIRTTDELYSFAPRMIKRLQQAPMLRDVASDQEVGGLSHEAGVRPQHRIPSRHLTLDHRPNALRRLRPAGSVHHLHAVEPVPRGLGGGPVLYEESCRTCATSSFVPTRAARTGSTGLVAGGSSAAQLYGPTSSLTAANTSLSNSTSASAVSSSSHRLE